MHHPQPLFRQSLNDCGRKAGHWQSHLKELFRVVPQARETVRICVTRTFSELNRIFCYAYICFFSMIRNIVTDKQWLKMVCDQDKNCLGLYAR